MNCTICNKPVVLIPSAKERAAKFGGKPSDYTNLFRQHAKCIVALRNHETMHLFARLYRGKTSHKPVFWNI